MKTITQEKAAELLGVSQPTVYRMVQSGAVCLTLRSVLARAKKRQCEAKRRRAQARRMLAAAKRDGGKWITTAEATIITGLSKPTLYRRGLVTGGEVALGDAERLVLT